jgi:hypothetical protein
MAQEKSTIAPPYVAFKSLINFLEWLKEGGIPTRLDRSFWGARLSGAYGAQVMSALHFLGLIEADNRPKPELELVVEDLEQRKKIIRKRLMESYAEVLENINLEKATLGELQEQFKVYSVSGETFRKAVVFFIHAAQYSGIPLSSHITKRIRTVKSNGTKKRGRKTAIQEGSQQARQRPVLLQEYDLHASILALLTDLAKIAPHWTQEARDKWLNTFTTNLDYAYPVKEQKAEASAK